MLYCHARNGDWTCPLKLDCYRHTQPTPGRDRFAALPYDLEAGSCAYFVSNQPSDEHIRTRAYYLWLAAGRPEGQAEQFWREAKRQAGP